MNVSRITHGSSVRVCSLLIFFIWSAVWFSSFKINLGLLLPLEFLFAYIGIIYLFSTGKLTLTQISGLLTLFCVVLLDFLRAGSLNAIMFLGFIGVLVFFISIRELVSFSRGMKIFILAAPITSILLKIIFPDWGKISTHDTIGLAGAEVSRFGLLGYESNSLAVCAALLMNSLIFGAFVKSKTVRISYSVILIGVVMATFSRTGMVAVCLSLIYGIVFGRRYQARYVCLALVGVCGVLIFVALQVSGSTSVLTALLRRISSLNFFSDERSSILAVKLNALMSDEFLMLMGEGFMKSGASDNSILSFLYGYGLLGSLFVFLLVLVSTARCGFSLKFFAQSFPVYIPMGLYLLTADIFGQAKVISVFFIILLMFSYSYKGFQREIVR